MYFFNLGLKGLSVHGPEVAVINDKIIFSRHLHNS